MIASNQSLPSLAQGQVLGLKILYMIQVFADCEESDHRENRQHSRDFPFSRICEEWGVLEITIPVN